MIENEVCYLVMCDKMYSKRSAFTYLEDLAQEFHKNYGRKVNTVTRPYAFIEFDVYIQKTKKNLTDRRRNINSINSQLQDVQRIMVSLKNKCIFTLDKKLIFDTLFSLFNRFRILMMFYKEVLFYLSSIRRLRICQSYRKNIKKMPHI